MTERQASAETHDDEDPICPNCGISKSWEDCEQCGGDGYVEAEYDDDCGDEGETVTCDQCQGFGGWYYCDQCRLTEVDG